MKLSCLPVSLYPDLTTGRLTPGAWFRHAARLGVDGADLSVAHVLSRAPAYLHGLCREAAEAGVQIAILATYSDFTHPDAAKRARQVDDVRAWIEAAALLEATFLRLTAGQARADVPQDVGLGWAIDGLTACLDDATAAGVGLLYENHVRGAMWSNNDFTQPAERFLEVVRRTAGSGLGILFDIANCLVRGDAPLSVLEQVRDRVGAIHVSDIRRVGAFEPTVIGTGVAPITPVLQIMIGGGFDGWVSVEEASRTGEGAFVEPWLSLIRHGGTPEVGHDEAETSGGEQRTAGRQHLTHLSGVPLIPHSAGQRLERRSAAIAQPSSVGPRISRKEGCVYVGAAQLRAD